LSSILALLKLIYENKEKVVLGAVIVAFVGVGAYQWRANGSDDSTGNSGGKKPSKPPRAADTFEAPQIGNQYSLQTILELTAEKKNIFEEPGSENTGSRKGGQQDSEWAEIVVKSIFDATRSGSYIAIIEVDKRRRFVKEGEHFGEYEVRRIDGVKKCLTMVRRGSGSEGDEKEFCAEE
jgi:hypothetical protein